MWVLDFYAVEPTGNEEVARLAWEEQLGRAGTAFVEAVAPLQSSGTGHGN